MLKQLVSLVRIMFVIKHNFRDNFSHWWKYVEISCCEFPCVGHLRIMPMYVYVCWLFVQCHQTIGSHQTIMHMVCSGVLTCVH